MNHNDDDFASFNCRVFLLNVLLLITGVTIHPLCLVVSKLKQKGDLHWSSRALWHQAGSPGRLCRRVNLLSWTRTTTVRSAPCPLCLRSPLRPPRPPLPPPLTPSLPQTHAPVHTHHLRPVDWGCSQHPRMWRAGVGGTDRSRSLKPAAAFRSAWMTTASAPQTCSPERSVWAVPVPVLNECDCYWRDTVTICLSASMSLVPPAGEVAVLQMKDTPGWRKAKRRSVCCTQDCEKMRWSVFLFLFVNCNFLWKLEWFCLIVLADLKTNYRTCFHSVALHSHQICISRTAVSPRLQVFTFLLYFYIRASCFHV